MTTSPEVRDLARRLLAYEAVAGETSERVEPASLRVYEKLRRGICSIAGVAGFQLLASRALALARSEAPSLGAASVTADGSLQGLAEFEHLFAADKDLADKSSRGDEGIFLIVRLLGLLHIFLGEALTLNLLRFTWPEAALDDYKSENGRKA